MFTHVVYSSVSVFTKLVHFIQLVFRDRNKQRLVCGLFLLERERESLVMEKKVSLKRVRPDSVYHFSTVV